MKEKKRKEKSQELKWMCLFFRLTPFIQGERRILNSFNLTKFFFLPILLLFIFRSLPPHPFRSPHFLALFYLAFGKIV